MKRPADNILLLSLLLLLIFLQPSYLSTPNQSCKLIRKFVDATGEVDLHNLFLDSQFEDFLRQNPSVICISWRIVGYDREAIRLQFREFNISSRGVSNSHNSVPSDHELRGCWGNTVYIRDSDSALAKERPAVSTIIGPYCGNLSEPIFWWSNGNDIVIEYNIRSVDQAKRDIFKFQFSVLTPMHGCGYEAIVYSPSVNINASTGELSAPFDRTVATHSRCSWSIVAPEDTAFSIEFLKYNIDANAPFVLNVNDVYDDGNTIIGPRCCGALSTVPPNGNNKNLKNLESYEDVQCLCLKGNPPEIQSSSNVISIYYESRTSVLTTVNQGFTLKWRHIRRANVPTTTSTISSTTTTATEFSTTPKRKEDYEYAFEETAPPASWTSDFDYNVKSEPAIPFQTPPSMNGDYNVINTKTQYNERLTPSTMPPPVDLTKNAAVEIPIIYIDDTSDSNSFQQNGRTQRHRQTTSEQTNANGEQGHEIEGRRDNNDGSPIPPAIFGASNRATQSSNNCVSVYQLSSFFLAPLLCALGGIVLLK